MHYKIGDTCVLYENIDKILPNKLHGLYENIDKILPNKLHGQMHYKIGVICLYNGHVL